MTRSSIQAVIFDLDDTLYPERQFAFSGYAAVVREMAPELGWNDAHLSMMRDLFEGPHRSRVFDAVLEQTGATDEQRAEFVPRMIQIYRHHPPTLSLHEDADRLLGRLAGRYPLGIISDGFLRTQELKIAALDLASRVQAVVLTDRWGRDYWKPHPRAFEEAATQLRVSHSACVYVADNAAKDFVAARHLGWDTVCIHRSDGVYRDMHPAPGGEPRLTIHTLDELEEILLP